MKTTVTAEQLRIGDTIETWWRPGRDTITGLRPYTGPLACLRAARGQAFAAGFRQDDVDDETLAGLARGRAA